MMRAARGKIAVDAGERIERALALLVGTAAAVVVFLGSFFVLFAGEAPPGLVPVFVTVTFVLGLIPGTTAAVRLALGVRAARGVLPDGLDASAIIARSIWSGIAVNAGFAGIGIVASLGTLTVVLLPYLIAASALVAAVAAPLAWGAARVTCWTLGAR